MFDWALAAGAGLLAGSALLVGALIAWRVDVPRKIVASIMAFGAGVLIATLSFDLVGEAVTEAGIWPTVWGFATGAVVYVAGTMPWMQSMREIDEEQPQILEQEQELQSVRFLMEFPKVWCWDYRWLLATG
jgi:hypothetical protein